MQTLDGGLVHSEIWCTDVEGTKMREQEAAVESLLPEATREGRKEECRAKEGAELMGCLTRGELNS